MDKKRNRLYRDMRLVKTHYKAYKAGKRWLIAGISIATFGSFLMTSTAHADTVNESPAITAQASTQVSDPAAVSSTSAEQATSGESSTTTTQGTSAAQTQSTTESTSDASQTTVTNSETANLPVGTTTSTGTDGSVTVDLPAGATSEHIAAAKQAVVASGTSTGTVTAKDGVSADASGATTSADNTASTDTTTATSLKSIDQLGGKYIDDKGNVSDTAPGAMTIGGQTGSSDDMSTEVTGDLTKVTTADGKDTYYVSDDGNFVGQGGVDAATGDKEVIVADTGDDYEEFGKVYVDANGKQWVKLVNSAQNSAASYAYKNQINTNASFDIKGEWQMNSTNAGGGLGIILQPVLPQTAGVGSGASAAADIGILGQPSTTFVGFDGWVSGDKNTFDTGEGVLTIRQTNATDGKSFVDLTLGNPDPNSGSDADKILKGNTNGGGTESPNQMTNPRTSAVSTGKIDVLYDVNWTPDDTQTSASGVAGTLTATLYNSTDSNLTTPIKVLTVTDITLPSSTAIALFGAFGGGGGSALAQGRITSFTLTPVTQQVTVNYIDVDSGNTVKDTTHINASVGNTLDVAATTSGDSASYGAPTIDGYTFVGAVGTDISGNFQKADMQVVDPTMTTGTGTYNTINVYYKTTKETQQQAIATYTTPDGVTIPAVSQGSAGASNAIHAGTKTAITDANGQTIALGDNVSAVPIQQVAGYISGYTLDNGAWTASTEIPGDSTGNYVVSYRSTDIELTPVKVSENATGFNVTLKAPQDGLDIPTVNLTAADVAITKNGVAVETALSDLQPNDYTISLTSEGQAKVATAYGLATDELNFETANTTLTVAGTDTVTDDADGGQTTVTRNNVKQIVIIQKKWSDGALSRIEINVATGEATLTETGTDGSVEGPEALPANTEVTAGNTKVNYGGSGAAFSLEHMNPDDSKAVKGATETISATGEPSYVNTATVADGGVAGTNDYLAGTVKTVAELTEAQQPQNYIDGYLEAVNTAAADFQKGQDAGNIVGLNNQTPQDEASLQQAPFDQAYINGYLAGYDTGKASYDTDEALGEKDGIAAGLAGQAAPTRDSKGYVDGVSKTYATAKQQYDADVLVGAADGTTAGEAREPETDLTGQSQGYQDGYNSTYQNAKDEADTSAGQLAGQEAGLAGEDEATITAETDNYQKAYTAAYTTAKASYDTDRIAGAAAGTAAGEAREAATDLTAQSQGYADGYNSTYQDAKDTADVTAGTESGKRAGLAGEAADDNLTETDKFKSAYTDAYTTAKASYDQDKVSGAQAGQSDGAGRLAQADLTTQSQGYIDGYNSAYVDAKNVADTAAGKLDGAEAGLAGKVAADVTTETTAYQDAYTAAYTTAKASYDTDRETGATAGANDGNAREAEADLTGQSQGYVDGYNDTYQAAKDEADTTAGAEAGIQAGLAGEAIADNETESEKYQVAYTDAYTTAKASYDNDRTEGLTAGETIGLSGNPSADVTNASKGYQAGYADGYQTGLASYHADEVLGQTAGTADGDSRVDPAADLSTKSQGYQDGYNATYAPAKNKADQTAAINDANAVVIPENLAKNTDVVTANQKLQAAITVGENTPTTTDAINAATEALRKAIETTGAAYTAGSDLMKQTTPVTNESDVKQAIDTLTATLETGTATQIADETTALQTALKQANEDRDAAVVDAGTVVIDATIAGNTDVIAAKANLDDALKKGESDQGTTANITEMTVTLRRVMTTATTAYEQGQAALQTAEPVDNEDEVATLMTQLNVALKSGKTDDIQALTNQLNQISQTAQTNRNVAIADAEKVQTDVPAALKTNADVTAAVDALTDKLAKGTTEDIATATTALETATSVTNQAVTAGNTAIKTAKFVANEPTVAPLLTALQAIITTGTAEAINSATTALTEATQPAQEARDAAVTAGNAVQVPTEVMENSDVQTAQTGLTAALDSGTTETMVQATQNLTTAISTTTAAKAKANVMIDHAGIVANETAVKTAIQTLTELLDSGRATDIEAATTALDGLLDQTDGERTEVVATATAVEVPENVSENADVTAAKSRLDTAISSGTIADITTATEALKNAIQMTGDAQQTGQLALGETTPVAQETEVQTAMKGLNDTLLTGTVDNIDGAIATLQKAVKTATQIREAAVDNANQMTVDELIAGNVTVKTAQGNLTQALSDAEAGTVKTDTITEKTTELQMAIDDAKQATANGQAALATAKPVNNEAEIERLTTQLTDLLTSGSTDEINKAITDLTATSKTALADRQTATEKAAETQANVTTDIAQNSDVMTAGNVLTQQLKVGTTAEIDQAVTVLQATINSTTTAKQTANIALDSQGTVANEPSIKAKVDTLTNLLATGATADIVAATQALTTDIDQATYSRTTVINAANAIEMPTNLKNNTTVASAQTKLQGTLDGGTTSDIMTATTTLTNAITAATLAQSTATAALDNVAPVDNEGRVQTAVALLNTALIGGTTAEITEATEQLTTAVQTAQTARTTAINNAMTIVVPGDQVANEEVKAARETLNGALANGTTDDVINAAAALTNTVKAVADAKTTANTALGNLGEVANEETVQTVVTELTDLLTTGTADAIEQAATMLQQTTTATKTARDTATTAANAVQVPTELKANQDVKQTTDKLTTALTTGTTDDVAKATTALTTAINNTNQALTNAKATLTGVGRVANEQPVVDAMTILTKTFTTGSAAEIEAATTALTEALQTAQPQRDAATTAANAVVISTPLKASADVTAAQTALTTALQIGTTAMIEQATADLNTAIATTGTARSTGQAALATANATTLTKETGVANAMTQLATLLANGTATATELTQATRNLATEVGTAEASRATSIDTAEAVAMPTELAHQQDVLGTNDALISAVTAAKFGTGTTAAIVQATIALQNVITTAKTTNDVARAAIAVVDLSTTATTPLVQSAKQQLQTLLDGGTATIAQLKQATTNLATAVETARTTFTQSWSDGAISTIHIADNHELTVTTVAIDGTRTTATITGGNGTADGLTFATPADGVLSVSKTTTVAEGQLVETLTVPRTTAITATTTLTTNTPVTTNITVPATTVTTTTVTPTGDTTVTTVVTSQLGKQGQVVTTVAPDATTATVVLLPNGTDALTATDTKRSTQSDGAQVLTLTTPQADGSQLTQQLIIKTDGTVSYAKTAKYTDTDGNVATVETNANAQLVQLTTYDAGTKQAVVVDAAGIAQLLAIADRTGSQTVAGFTITKTDDGSLAVTWVDNSGTATYAVGTDNQGNFAYNRVAVTKDADGTTVVTTNLDADVTAIDKTWNDQSKTSVQVSQRTTAIQKVLQQLLQDKGVLPTTTPEQAAVSATVPTQHLANDVNLDYDATTDSYVLHKATDQVTNYHTAVTVKHGNVSDSKDQLYQTDGSQTVITTQLTADGAQLTQADTIWLDGSQSTIRCGDEGTYQLIEQSATGETKATDLTPGTTVTAGTLSFTATPDGNVAGVQTTGDTQLILGADAAGNFTANQVTTVTNNGNTTKVVTDDTGTPVAMSQTWSDGSQTNLNFSDTTATTSPLAQLVQRLLNQIGATSPDAITVADDAQQVGSVMIKRDGNKVTLSKVTAGNVETSASVDQQTGAVKYQQTTLSQPEVVTETIVETVPTASTEQVGDATSDGTSELVNQADGSTTAKHAKWTNEKQSANNDPKVAQHPSASGQTGNTELKTIGSSEARLSEANGDVERISNTSQFTTDGKPSLTSQTARNAASEATKQGQLPQTDDHENAAASLAGLGLLAGLAGALGLRRKRREE